MKHSMIIQTLYSSLSRTLFRGKASADPAEFRALFDRFRSVLDSNNRALETITDMGEKLGGDYLFDIVYVNGSYSRLRAEMENSLRLFADLTGRRFSGLEGRFREIDERIRTVIDETPSASEPFILTYDRITADMTRVVGGKNASLAEVRNAIGLAVPDAFAVTTAAFDAFLQENRIFEKIALPGPGAPILPSVLHEIRELMLHGTMPAPVSRAIEKTVKKLRARCGEGCSLAVRSSAGEEDGDFSFAGQFETVLNVPLDPGEIEKAYRKVIASLFSEPAAAYQARLGYGIRDMRMAVACMVMVDAASSGVIYTTTPEGDANTLIINAVWGLGEAVVEGRAEADLYVVSKRKEPVLKWVTPGRKESMIRMAGKGETEEIRTPEELRDRTCLSPETAAAVARHAMAIERYFGSARDIEWAIDSRGKFFVLQARPLAVQDRSDPPASANGTANLDPAGAHPVLLQDRGTVVQRGTGAGKVFIVRKPADILNLPKGVVLVAPSDSSLFASTMPYVSAIITERGSQTSHMAALCRELRIPTIVGLSGATESLKHGQPVTVVAGDDNRSAIYGGIVPDLVARADRNARRMENVYEFRRKRYLLRSITPLNLVDPLRDEFTPKACRTLHDVLRFIHEKSVAALIDGARRGVRSGAVRLDLSVPAGIMLIDIGGGVDNPENHDQVTAGQISSIPLRAVINGMTLPGLWRSDAVPLGMNDFMTSMLRVPDITAGPAGRVEQNMAVISREYANISLKFGYHFIVMDCFCSEQARNNHIYFRFAGGATDMTKRSRRLQLIAAILEEYGFNIKTKGDLILARLANIQQEDAVKVLDQLGRLFSYTRQLDAVLNDDRAVERYVRSFLEGKYELADAAEVTGR